MANRSNRNSGAGAGTSFTAASSKPAAPAEASEAPAAPAEADDGAGAIRAEDNTEAGRQPDGEASAAPAGTDPSSVEMVEVHTTGAFFLQDPFTQEVLEPYESRTVPKTSFITSRLESKQLAKGKAPKKPAPKPETDNE